MKLPKLPRLSSRTLLTISAVLTLLAIGLMVWSVLVPTPLPVMLAMSVGQGIGTASLGLYGYVVFVDLLRKRKAARESLPPPLGAPAHEPEPPAKEPPP